MGEVYIDLKIIRIKIFFNGTLSSNLIGLAVTFWVSYLVICFWDKAIAYSATTVFPADVWAAMKTDSLFSKQRTACFWKVSNSKGLWSKFSFIYGAFFWESKILPCKSHMGYSLVKIWYWLSDIQQFCPFRWLWFFHLIWSRNDKDGFLGQVFQTSVFFSVPFKANLSIFLPRFQRSKKYSTNLQMQWHQVWILQVGPVVYSRFDPKC